MKLGLSLKTLLVAAACAGALPATAATVWDEAVNGDLSGNGLAPTPLAMGVGANRILGSTGNPGTGVDRDYFSFVVPDGTSLSSLLLLDNTAVSGGVSFIGMQAGAQLTVTPSGGGASALIGFAHYGNDQIGQDILPSVLVAPLHSLSSGTYSVWVQDTGGPATYGFDFVISAVPEPAAAVLLAAGLLSLGALRRR